MKKTLIAKKVDDGWLVEVARAYVVYTESEVRDIARYEGLQVKKAVSSSERIYAD